MNDNPAYPNIGCVDVSIDAHGPAEDVVYALHPRLQKSIRRGNTLIEVYDANDHALYKYLGVARKGLRKFYDLKPEYLISDEDFRQSYSPETAKKQNKGDSKAVIESNLRNYIFAGVVKSLNDGAYIEVIKSLKVNGENAQISWVKEERVWCIASKNVGLLANNVADLAKYDSSPSSRYVYAVSIARTWFKIISKLARYKKSLSKLQESLAGKTLIGEYVGNPYLQHIVKYTKETIVFYAVTDNNSDDKNCLLPEEAYAIFNEFNLDCVPCERIGMFDNIDSLSDALNHEHKIVSSGSIQREEEGAVIYMVRRGVKDDKVLSLSKLKSLEYRIFRKLREKLRNFWQHHQHVLEWKQGHQEQYDASYQKFVNECKELVKNAKLPQPFEYYMQFADHAYNTAQQQPILYDKLFSFYVDFLEHITKEFNMDKRIFTSMVFKQTSSKQYKNLSGKELKSDNDSWFKRKPNTSYYADVEADSPSKLEKKKSIKQPRQSK